MFDFGDRIVLSGGGDDCLGGGKKRQGKVKTEGGVEGETPMYGVYWGV